MCCLTSQRHGSAVGCSTPMRRRGSQLGAAVAGAASLCKPNKLVASRVSKLTKVLSVFQFRGTADAPGMPRLLLGGTSRPEGSEGACRGHALQGLWHCPLSLDSLSLHSLSLPLVGASQ